MYAEREGFEPSKGLHPCRFSRAVPSTTQPPLQIYFFKSLISSGLKYFQVPADKFFISRLAI